MAQPALLPTPTRSCVHLNAFVLAETRIQVRQTLTSLAAASEALKPFFLTAYATACGRDVAATDFEEFDSLLTKEGAWQEGEMLALNSLAFGIFDTQAIDAFVRRYQAAFVRGYESFVRSEVVIIFTNGEVHVEQVPYLKLFQGMPPNILDDLSWWETASKHTRGIRVVARWQDG